MALGGKQLEVGQIVKTNINNDGEKRKSIDKNM
jgi:hypothetical protein